MRPFQPGHTCPLKKNLSTALAKFRQSRLLCPNPHGFTNFANSTKFSIELRQRCHFRYCLHLWTYLPSCLEAIKNAGNSSRRFLAASPLRALAKGKAVHVICFEISLSSLTVTPVSSRDSLVNMKTRDVIEASHLQSGRYQLLADFASIQIPSKLLKKPRTGK